MTKEQEQTMTELQELMCDHYCKWPVISNDQDVLNDRCNGCQMIKLWNFVNKGESD